MCSALVACISCLLGLGEKFNLTTQCCPGQSASVMMFREPMPRSCLWIPWGGFPDRKTQDPELQIPSKLDGVENLQKSCGKLLSKCPSLVTWAPGALVTKGIQVALCVSVLAKMLSDLVTRGVISLSLNGTTYALQTTQLQHSDVQTPLPKELGWMLARGSTLLSQMSPILKRMCSP